MKLTATQLRNIIREEVKKATLGKKNLSEGMARITEDEVAAWRSGNLGYVSGDSKPESRHDHEEFLHGSEEGHPYDAEGDMVKSRLSAMSKMSGEISELLHDEDQLPAWVQDLVATSHNDLQHVYDYLTDEASEMAAQQTMPVGESRNNKSKNLNESHTQVTQDEMRAWMRGDWGFVSEVKNDPELGEVPDFSHYGHEKCEECGFDHEYAAAEAEKANCSLL